MIGRLLFLALALGSSALSAGCLLDAGPYSNDGSGGSTTSTPAGGSGGGGGSTSTSSSTTTTDTGGSGGTTTTDTGGSGGTTTTTTSSGGCATEADCPSQGPCKSKTCVNNACMYANLGDTTFVSNDDPLDCKQTVCDGLGGTKEIAANEIPDSDPNDCTVSYCIDVNVQTDSVDDNTPCGGGQANQCSANVCMGGICSLQQKPDGTVITAGNNANCLDTVCSGGALSQTPNWERCIDPGPGNCFVPSCSGVGVCLTGPGGMNAPAGYDCKHQPNDMPGKCNAIGQCCINGQNCQ